MGIKITRKLLNNYKKYKRGIPLLEAELRGLRTTDAGLGNSVINDYSTGYARPQSVVGFDRERYQYKCDILEHYRAKAGAVEEWIEAIPDAQTRCVFRMRYMEGASWAKVARVTGYAGKEDYVRLHIRDDYLKKCNIK
ncbi:MAG: hypothetical protein LUE24_13890 [Lachnospiraceae bacterium]|nr:hypothetical protein [Lachnospiraceae bacterium]